MNVRTLILTLLVAALVGLGGLYFHLNKKIDDYNKAVVEQQKQSELAEKQREIDNLKAELQRNSDARNAQLAAAPDMATLQTAPGPRIPDARFDNEGIKSDLQQERDLYKEENLLLAESYKGKLSSENEMVRQVGNARLVGRVDSYDRDYNIVAFFPVGQPSLTAGQELAIRRNGAIFAYLIVDELDENGVYIATAKLDDLMQEAIDVRPIGSGDEVIIPPLMLQGDIDSVIQKEREELSPKRTPEAARSTDEIPFL